MCAGNLVGMGEVLSQDGRSKADSESPHIVYTLI